MFNKQKTKFKYTEGEAKRIVDDVLATNEVMLEVKSPYKFLAYTWVNNYGDFSYNEIECDDLSGFATERAAKKVGLTVDKLTELLENITPDVYSHMVLQNFENK